MHPNDAEFRLLNNFQRDFPLEPRPFASMATLLGMSEAEVLGQIARLRATGTVSRLGAVIAPNTLGASTLVAMRVPAARLDQVAAAVSAHEEVNHNYEREHGVNLWFVATAANRRDLTAVLGEIEAETGLPVLDLPLEASYHIDLGFDLRQGSRAAALPEPRAESGAGVGFLDSPVDPPTDPLDRHLLLAIEDGLALEPRPYADLALRAGLSEADVLARLSRLIASGVVRRLGLIVRHHELGYRANAMAVWDVSDGDVDDLGRRLAAEDGVTLCYRRTRRPPQWPYNLYCMIHGRHRDTVCARIEEINETHGLKELPHAILFSLRRFKQRGARYGAAPMARVTKGAA